jgi:hypothetical protein
MSAPILKKGSKSRHVKVLKYWLNEVCLPTPALKPETVFDAATEEAVKQFQYFSHLTPVNGQVDGKTWAAMGMKLGARAYFSAPGGGDTADVVTALKKIVDNLLTGSLNFDKVVFFSHYSEEFGIPNQSQLSGISALLDFIDRDSEITDIRWAAYMLATVKLECGNTWRPIEEWGKGTGREYGKAVSIKGTDGKNYSNAYYGRGYCQITWKSNYEKLGNALGMGDALVVRPELALQPDIAYRILSYGMRNGSFTGRKLSSYISGTKCDYYNARQIINGHNRAADIQSDANKFELILRASELRMAAV